MIGSRTQTLAIMGVALALLAVANASAAPPTPEKVRAMGAWMAVVLLVVLLKAAVVAGAMTAKALFSGAVERAESRIATQPVRASFIGLGGLALGLWLTGTMFHLGERAALFSWIGLALLCATIALTLCGLAAVYACAGRRLSGSQDTEGGILRGGATLETAAMIPFLGWLGQFTMLCMGFGAGLLALRDRGKADAQNEEGA